jgi:hypothetical protein
MLRSRSAAPPRVRCRSRVVGCHYGDDAGCVWPSCLLQLRLLCARAEALPDGADGAACAQQIEFRLSTTSMGLKREKELMAEIKDLKAMRELTKRFEELSATADFHVDNTKELRWVSRGRQDAACSSTRGC